MSGQLPVFATAPRMKIYIGNQPVAFALGLNINISIDVQDVYVIGQYAPVTNEPLMYNLVTGTMQIQRLVSAVTQTQINTIANDQGQLTEQQGRRAVADFSKTSQGGEVTAPTGENTNSVLLNSTLANHLDPAKVLLSQAFNVRLYMKVPNLVGGAFQPTPDGLNLIEKEWMEIQNCRITSENTNIAMGQIVNLPINFQGLLATSTVTGQTRFTLDNLVKQASVTGQ